jgi:type IV secretion system protein VirB8
LADNGGSYQLSAPALEGHYKAVRSFSNMRERAARIASTVLAVALGGSILVNIGLACSLALMMPLKKLVPVYFVVRSDGTIDSSPALSALAPSTDQAVIRSELWQYVQARESYSYDNASYNYNIVSGMSDTTTRGSYQQYFNYPNPESPQVTIGKKGVISVQLISVALISSNVAQVRFQRTLDMDDDDPIVTTWTATEQFEQIETLPESERLEDPGGVIITNYQVEQDTAQ